MEIREANLPHAAAFRTTPGLACESTHEPTSRPPKEASARSDSHGAICTVPASPIPARRMVPPVALAGLRRGAVRAGQEPGVHEAFAFDVDHSSVGDLEVVAKKSSGLVVDLDTPG